MHPSSLSPHLVCVCVRMFGFVRIRTAAVVPGGGHSRWVNRTHTHTHTHTLTHRRVVHDCPCGTVECLNTNVASPPGATQQGQWIILSLSLSRPKHTMVISQEKIPTMLHTESLWFNAHVGKLHACSHFFVKLTHSHTHTFCWTMIPDGAPQKSRLAKRTIPPRGYHGDPHRHTHTYTHIHTPDKVLVRSMLAADLHEGSTQGQLSSRTASTLIWYIQEKLSKLRKTNGADKIQHLSVDGHRCLGAQLKWRPRAIDGIMIFRYEKYWILLSLIVPLYLTKGPKSKLLTVYFYFKIKPS